MREGRGREGGEERGEEEMGEERERGGEERGRERGEGEGERGEEREGEERGEERSDFGMIFSVLSQIERGSQWGTRRVKRIGARAEARFRPAPDDPVPRLCDHLR